MPVTTRLPVACLAALAALAGCQALDGLAVGRTDRVDAPPFVIHYAPTPAARGMVVAAPVALDDDTRLEILGDGREAALEPLARAMTERLGRMACCAVGQAVLPAAGQPQVYVGSAEGETAPAEALEQRWDWDKYPPMVVHLEEGSAGWRAAHAGADARPVLLLRLAIVDYPKADEGFFGKKVVLGPGHEVGLKFLSAEMAPVQVLQVTGILLGPDGRALAAGGEGILAFDSPFWVQVFEARKEIDPAMLRRALESERRDDLPGRPFKWEAALDSLVAALLDSGG